jgi:hypothetical protein
VVPKNDEIHSGIVLVEEEVCLMTWASASSRSVWLLALAIASAWSLGCPALADEVVYPGVFLLSSGPTGVEVRLLYARPVGDSGDYLNLPALMGDDTLGEEELMEVQFSEGGFETIQKAVAFYEGSSIEGGPADSGGDTQPKDNCMPHCGEGRCQCCCGGCTWCCIQFIGSGEC